MKRFFRMALLLCAGLILFAGPALAWSWNPLDWFKGGVESAGSAVFWAVFTALIAWLGKGKWDAVQLKRAVGDIKNAVDSVRMANDANSPGGNKVVIGEYVGIAEKSFTAILSTLRGINPGWIPHWIGEPEPKPLIEEPPPIG